MNRDERLQRALREVLVRFARDAEGMAIAQLVHTCHEGVPKADWSKVYPNWMVAEKDGEVIGCVQLCYAKPIGRLEFLSFVPGLPYRTRALAVRSLLSLASMALRHSGATAVAGTVGFEQKSFKEILKKNDCRVVVSGNVFVRAI